MLTPDISRILFELADEQSDEAGTPIQVEICRFIRPALLTLF